MRIMMILPLVYMFLMDCLLTDYNEGGIYNGMMI